MKGLILAGGYGSRFFPVTKTLPKEMLPLIDRPSIDFIVEEMLLAGIRDILIVSSRRKGSIIEDYFDRDIELETYVSNPSRLARIKESDDRKGLSVYFIRQKEMRGTGDAVLLGRSFLGASPFVLAFPDDIVFSSNSLSSQLVSSYEETGKSVLAVKHFPEGDISRYGVVESVGGVDISGNIIPVRGIVEKPVDGEEPSRFVSVGRYLLTDDVFSVLERGIEGHSGGEYYLTDALNELSLLGKVVACNFEGVLYDTGEPLGYVKAITSYALERDDISKEYLEFLNDLEQLEQMER